MLRRYSPALSHWKLKATRLAGLRAFYLSRQALVSRPVKKSRSLRHRISPWHSRQTHTMSAQERHARELDGSEWLRVSALRTLATHSRFFLTLRSQEGNYHSLILFRLSPDHLPASAKSEESRLAQGLRDQIYVMEASCPHLGADMSHAEIEECDSGIVAI
ncbi:hypothetical protein C8Q80DRAFT_261954 [Daedaleopsis nitida]|nr:hypothetical protein C8Q80DRAFT_261954 [Daedaleopsis nitida]